MFVDFLLLFSGVALIAYAFFKWATLNNDYFKNRNLKYLKPNFLVGNTGGVFANRYTVVEFAKQLYSTFPDEPIIGMFQFREPQYVVRDPEVIKQIAVKDFDHFEDHRWMTKYKDRVWANTLFFMTGEVWRNMRSTLSPAFTGNKMRNMFELIVQSADDVVEYFLKTVENGEKINVEIKEFFTRYTNDVIASCAYGLKVNSFAEPNNQFYVNAKTLSTFTGYKKLVQWILSIIFPKLVKTFKMGMYSDSYGKEFKDMILDTMDVRKKNNIYRPDMINILMQVREGTLKHQTDEKDKDEFATVQESEVGRMSVNRTWDDDEIVAQCFLFLIAGFDSSSTLLTFASYELAVNPSIQQKLYEEIVEANEKLGGRSITYEVLQKMKYLDQVICESLRKWTPGFQNDRICTKNYTFANDKLKFEIEKGKPVIFTVYGIHHDAKYWSEPEKFDPERFNDENKKNIVSGTYLPFGVGPRNCIASRFALMEIKAILYNLLLNFSFEPNEKTQIPVKLVRSMFSLLPENGVHLEFKPRNSSERHSK